MSGTITRRHLPLIREIYGDRVANAVLNAQRHATFLAVLIAQRLEDRVIMKEVNRLCKKAR